MWIAVGGAPALQLEMDRRTFVRLSLAGGVGLSVVGATPLFGAEATNIMNDKFEIGGDLTVNRLGFGAMRITGEGIWGWPKDRGEALKVLKRAVELGVNLIDTSDAYGPETSELLIAEALHPYPKGVVIATKGGLTRPGPNQWSPNGKPDQPRGGPKTEPALAGVGGSSRSGSTGPPPRSPRKKKKRSGRRR